MKEKHRIEGDNFMVSTDGGKTYKAVRKATEAEKASYKAHLEKKKQEAAEAQTKNQDKLSGKKSSVSAIKIDPVEEEERQKYIKSNPNKVVDQATYDRLMDLYNKAKKADPTGTKRTKEAEEFQRAYHDVLPEEASRIIAKHPVKTKKALKEGRPWWDLEGNVDQYFGPRTKQYMESLEAFKPKPEAEKEKPKVTIAPEEKKDATVPGQVVKRNPPVPIRAGAYAPWWLQDIVKISGAAADKARVKRYLPWQATPEVRLPDATFYDPTRELAANAEQANIQTQGLAAFTGPQTLSARSSAIQGQAAKNAADIMARYNTMNVQLANQLNQERTSIMNQAAQQKAALDTQLFDKYTIANQQFDNSMNMARQNLRQSYIDAITNRAKTQALNTLYPNYYTDPSRGGMLTFAPDFSKIPAEQPDNTNDYYEALRITRDPDRALRYLELRNKGAINDPYAERNAYRRGMNYPEEQG